MLETNEFAGLDDRLLMRGVARSLERIREAAGWTQQELSERMGISPETYSRVCRSEEGLSLTAGLRLAEELDLSLEAIFYGKFDAPALARRLRGDALVLPERYARAAYSRKRTSIHLLKYCDRYLGRSHTDRLLRSLQMNRLHFETPDAFISIQFLADACKLLLRAGVEREHLSVIGLQSSRVNRNSPLAETLKRCKSVSDAYDLQINGLMEVYEKNCSYRTISLDRDHCVIESRERPEVLDELGQLHIGSEETCLTKVGVASAISTFRGLPPARVVETHCVHRGDDACRFHVDLEKARWIETHSFRRLRPIPVV